MRIKLLLCLYCVVLASSCKDDVLPKPKAMLRLDYPEASYQNLNLDCSFSFDKNDILRRVDSRLFISLRIMCTSNSCIEKLIVSNHHETSSISYC